MRAAGEGHVGVATTVSLAGGEELHVAIALATALPESNWKPLLAGVFAAILEIVSLVASRIPGASKAVRKSIALTSLPFVVAEVSSGVASYFTGYLSVPPVIGPGSLVDSAILGAGLIVILLRTQPKGEAKDQAAR